uniref:DnaJ dnj-2 n=1 Tax=Ascaris suum TaxID=6253 RepID=F1L043_ASCSU
MLVSTTATFGIAGYAVSMYSDFYAAFCPNGQGSGALAFIIHQVLHSWVGGCVWQSDHPPEVSHRWPHICSQLLAMSLLFALVTMVAVVKTAEAVGLAPGLYCGLENCYDVLGIDRGNFQKSDVSKSYRRLAKKYHPDKVIGESKKAEAEEKFRLVATAYETLRDDETRADYDYYLDHPEQRAYNYYQYYRRRVAPKVDVRIVIFATVTLISVFQFLSAKHKYQEALDYAIRQEKYRNGAREIAKERGLLSDATGRKDKKSKRENTELIIRQIIEENMDIRGGYRKPSIYDTLLWAIVSLPYTLARCLIWYLKWFIRYSIKKEEYDEEAKLYLIRKNMGLSEGQFSCLSMTEQQCFLEEELWRKDAYAEWKRIKEEEEKERLANSGRYKRYRRFMKNQAGNTLSFLDE